MDLDGDGKTDILSGSYSWQKQPMAGTFHVLRGTGKGFAKPEELKGADDKPLIVTPVDNNGDADLARICTRPTAVDLNGDGNLDIVTGNFGGTFFMFEGQGEGKFSPESKKLDIKVSAHSDPYFVDWDRDGDMDLFSGSGQGGVFYFENTGSKTEPKFAKSKTILKPAGYGPSEPVFGSDHIKGPQTSTRVYVDDVNGDGKWDLLVGDSANLMFTPDGVDEETTRAKMKAWDKEMQELYSEIGRWGDVR